MAVWAETKDIESKDFLVCDGGEIEFVYGLEDNFFVAWFFDLILYDSNGFYIANDFARLKALVFMILNKIILQIVCSKLLYFYLLPSSLMFGGFLLFDFFCVCHILFKFWQDLLVLFHSFLYYLRRHHTFLHFVVEVILRHGLKCKLFALDVIRACWRGSLAFLWLLGFDEFLRYWIFADFAGLLQLIIWFWL